VRLYADFSIYGTSTYGVWLMVPSLWCFLQRKFTFLWLYGPTKPPNLEEHKRRRGLMQPLSSSGHVC